MLPTLPTAIGSLIPMVLYWPLLCLRQRGSCDSRAASAGAPDTSHCLSPFPPVRHHL